MTALLDEHLTTFLRSPIMIVVGTRDPNLKPAIARSVAARVAGDELLDLFVSRSQWPMSVDHLMVEGAPVAVTCASPATYETYQIKGYAMAVAPADDEGRTFAEGAVNAAVALFTGFGVSRSQIDQWLTIDGLMRISIGVEEVYLQTPGPSAGQRRSELA